MLSARQARGSLSYYCALEFWGGPRCIARGLRLSLWPAGIERLAAAYCAERDSANVQSSLAGEPLMSASSRRRVRRCSEIAKTLFQPEVFVLRSSQRDEGAGSSLAVTVVAGVVRKRGPYQFATSPP